MVLVLNYAHQLGDTQLAAIAILTGETPEVRMIDSQIDRERPLAEVARELVDTVGLSPDQWETTPLVVNPPSLAPLALALIAELHGRCGGFVTMLNVRPVADSIPTRYEIAEIVNLQALREAARTRRARLIDQ